MVAFISYQNSNRKVYSCGILRLPHSKMGYRLDEWFYHSADIFNDLQVKPQLTTGEVPLSNFISDVMTR